MISKDELLSDLIESIVVEDEVTEKLCNFYKALGWKQLNDEEINREIVKGLDQIINETKNHSDQIKKIIKYVKESDKNEF